MEIVYEIVCDNMHIELVGAIAVCQAMRRRGGHRMR